jgi:hypothetical protein
MARTTKQPETFAHEYQRQALLLVQKHYGRMWKSKLIAGWQTGQDQEMAQHIAWSYQYDNVKAGVGFNLRDLGAYLRQCRNRYGFRCLDWI